jgi:hypothetical protein
MWIIDDFLPNSLHNDLHNLLLGERMSWTYMPAATSPDSPNEFYFVHKVISQEHCSPVFNDVKPVLYFMDDKLRFVIDNILRINCTLCTNQGRVIPQSMHVDFDAPHFTGIYYINTNNGPTVIEDTKVDSVANRFVLFDGLKKHAATIQDDTLARVNIVFNMQGHFRK